VPAGSPALSDEDVAAQIEEERRLAAEAGVGDVLAHHPDLDRLERAGRAAEIGRAVEARQGRQSVVKRDLGDLAVPAGSPALSDEDVAAQIEEERRLAPGPRST
jgi:hypothetical protein